MPEPVLNAVWRYFDNAAAHYGTPWPIEYKGTSDAARVSMLRSFGVHQIA